MSMNRLVLASNNAGKLKELQSLFEPLGLSLLPQSSFGVPEAEEPFHTFVENALAKARHASQFTGLPAIADDAGLCVDAFGGQPGVQTAYYAVQFGLPKGDDHNVTALLKNMQGQTNRRAALVSTLVAVRSPEDPEPLIAVGRASGLITHERQGSNGFGFDPVMWIESHGKTFAEMSDEEKNRISHRGRAAQRMVELIREQWLS
jgi:XTP/dITP diphosphohydrolase